MYLYCLDQAEDLFGGVGQVLAGGFRGHGFFQGGYGVENGEEGVNAVLVAEAGFRGGAAGESKDCFVVFFGDGGDTDGAFPMMVWPSRRPSPVITMSASLMQDSNLVSSRMIWMPDRRMAFV